MPGPGNRRPSSRYPVIGKKRRARHGSLSGDVAAAATRLDPVHVPRKPASRPLPAGLTEQPIMQLDGEPVDLAGQLVVGLELQLLFGEVMIRLGLLAVP